jgi:protein-tyrosine phosphatase
MVDNFRLFCDRANYPIYFHCSGGADRTGSLAWVLNAVLGVSRHETETDWEVTFYPDMPDARPDDWRGERHFDEGFGKYGDADAPWEQRVVLYLKKHGITDGEIAAFRSIMLSGEVE